MEIIELHNDVALCTFTREFESIVKVVQYDLSQHWWKTLPKYGLETGKHS